MNYVYYKWISITIRKAGPFVAKNKYVFSQNWQTQHHVFKGLTCWFHELCNWTSCCLQNLWNWNRENVCQIWKGILFFSFQINQLNKFCFLMPNCCWRNNTQKSSLDVTFGNRKNYFPFWEWLLSLCEWYC